MSYMHRLALFKPNEKIGNSLQQLILEHKNNIQLNKYNNKFIPFLLIQSTY
jgi:hypothetical protein